LETEQDKTRFAKRYSRYISYMEIG